MRLLLDWELSKPIQFCRYRISGSSRIGLHQSYRFPSFEMRELSIKAAWALLVRADDQAWLSKKDNKPINNISRREHPQCLPQHFLNRKDRSGLHVTRWDFQTQSLFPRTRRSSSQPVKQEWIWRLASWFRRPYQSRFQQPSIVATRLWRVLEWRKGLQRLTRWPASSSTFAMILLWWKFGGRDIRIAGQHGPLLESLVCVFREWWLRSKRKPCWRRDARYAGGRVIVRRRRGGMSDDRCESKLDCKVLLIHSLFQSNSLCHPFLSVHHIVAGLCLCPFQTISSICDHGKQSGRCRVSTACWYE